MGDETRLTVGEPTADRPVAAGINVAFDDLGMHQHAATLAAAAGTSDDPFAVALQVHSCQNKLFSRIFVLVYNWDDNSSPAPFWQLRGVDQQEDRAGRMGSVGVRSGKGGCAGLSRRRRVRHCWEHREAGEVDLGRRG